MEHIKPNNVEEITEVLRWSLATATPLAVLGGGSKRAVGRPVDARHEIDVSALRGIVSYEPGELVLSARAATPLRQIAEALAAAGQHLAFEPPDFGFLLGVDTGGATLGGLVATGLAGPRRLKAGSVRDHLLGVTAISGRAETFVSGGKVVKNVTGYDLPKLLAGSHGTLAIFTELTLKTLPAPADTRTLIALGLDAQTGLQVLKQALASTAEVSAAAHVPADVSIPELEAGVSATLLRMEGPTPSVDARLASLRALLAGHPQRVLARDASLQVWMGIRDVLPFAQQRDRPLWRICVPPARGAAVAGEIRQTLPGARVLFDWAGGLLWVELASAEQTGAAQIRAIVAQSGGQAMLLRASLEQRAATAVFQPQAAALAALSLRVKAQFDPADLLNRGRMNH